LVDATEKNSSFTLYADGRHRSSVKSSSHVIRSRADRINAAKQEREKKRNSVVEARRRGAGAPPSVVAVLPLSDDVDVLAIWNGLVEAFSEPETINNTEGLSLNKDRNGMDVDDRSDSNQGTFAPNLVPTILTMPQRRNTSFMLLPPSLDRSDPLSVVEIGKTAEIVICVLSGKIHTIPIDKEGETALAILRSMGLPSMVTSFQCGTVANIKEKSAAKKRVSEELVRHLAGDHRYFAVDTPTDFRQLTRHLVEATHTKPLWRQQRAQVLVESVEYSLSEQMEGSIGKLLLTGYLRSNELSASQAIHVPGAGDFQLEMIEACSRVDQRRLDQKSAAENQGSVMNASMDHESSWYVFSKSEPLEREPLTRENDFDPLDAEQTWPTEEELAAAELENRNRSKRRLPKGTSDYQAAWILDRDHDDEEEDEGDQDDEDEEDKGMARDIPGHDRAGAAQLHEGSMADMILEDDDDGMTDGLGLEDDDERDGDNNMMAALKARRAAESNEMEFPDEIEVPSDVAARQRFARYRGLKSFRTSPWDPREDLPQDYARVFAFENFKNAAKRAQRTPPKPDSVPVGMYVRLHVIDVPKDAACHITEHVAAFWSGQAPPLSIFGLLQHECKMSVANFAVHKAAGYEEPIANKQELLFFTGLRSFIARPVYSTDDHGADKHKMERFLLDGHQMMATVYAPISFPPLPLLAFNLEGNKAILAATGVLRDYNPDRVVVKKIVLSGYPVRAHKSKAVVRWMFHNPDDVRWFRPVELWTKNGRRGRIKEPVGTHGGMKCVFDGSLGQQDVVCMSLYKRAYPKWPSDLAFA
jgi:pre-rRNA-processing protein TSR1